MQAIDFELFTILIFHILTGTKLDCNLDSNGSAS